MRPNPLDAKYHKLPFGSLGNDINRIITLYDYLFRAAKNIVVSHPIKIAFGSSEFSSIDSTGKDPDESH